MKQENKSSILKNPMIQLETSYGSLRIPLGSQIKVFRYNPLFLPHGIVFLDTGFVTSTDTFFDNHYFTSLKYSSSSTTTDTNNNKNHPSHNTTTHSHETIIHYCWRDIRTFQLQTTGALYEYDIYINNPFNDTSIHITDIWLTLDVDTLGYNYIIL
jgi:hypothetical protein